MFDMNNYEDIVYKIVNENNMIDICMVCNNRNDRPYIITSCSTKHNDEFVNNNAINPLFVGHVGGSIILFPGDIGFTWYSKESKLQDITNDVVEYLKQYNKDVRLDGNDVMLGDNKLFGTMSSETYPYYEGMHFSFNTELDVIKNACIKPMKKLPIGLSSIGVTPEEMGQLAERLAIKYNLQLYGGEN